MDDRGAKERWLQNRNGDLANTASLLCFFWSTQQIGVVVSESDEDCKVNNWLRHAGARPRFEVRGELIKCRPVGSSFPMTRCQTHNLADSSSTTRISVNANLATLYLCQRLLDKLQLPANNEHSAGGLVLCGCLSTADSHSLSAMCPVAGHDPPRLGWWSSAGPCLRHEQQLLPHEAHLSANSDVKRSLHGVCITCRS